MIKFKSKVLCRVVPMSAELISKYKSPDNLLKHLDPKDTGFMFLTPQDDLIGYIAWDGNIITALEVIKGLPRYGFQ